MISPMSPQHVNKVTDLPPLLLPQNQWKRESKFKWQMPNARDNLTDRSRAICA